jgi:hypothetical protein
MNPMNHRAEKASTHHEMTGKSHQATDFDTKGRDGGTQLAMTGNKLPMR